MKKDAAQDVIEDREATHGDYMQQSRVCQRLKDNMRGARGGAAWNALSPDQKETLDMVAVKISRILHGNPNEPDHWLDILGYVKLVHNRLTKGKSL